MRCEGVICNRLRAGRRGRPEHGGDLLGRVEERQAVRVRRGGAIGRTQVPGRVGQQQEARLRRDHVPGRDTRGGQIQEQRPGDVRTTIQALHTASQQAQRPRRKRCRRRQPSRADLTAEG